MSNPFKAARDFLAGGYLDAYKPLEVTIQRHPGRSSVPERLGLTNYHDMQDVVAALLERVEALEKRLERAERATGP